MFYVFCLFTPLYRRFRLSRVSHAQVLDEIYRLVSKILNFMPCGSVFDRFCLEALKVDENDENPSFTFSAFLPPYIGVSGCLVSGMGKSVKRSIDWYQKFLISYLAARYSTVFVFHLKCLILLFWNVVEAIAGRARANSLPHVLGLQIFLALGGGC